MDERDDNTEEILFRLRNGEERARTMKNYEGFMLETYGKLYRNTNGREVMILGARNGIDEN